MSDSHSFRFLLYISKNYSIPVFKPIVAYLKAHNYSYRFYLSKKVKQNFPENWEIEKSLESLKTAKGYNPDFVLVSGNFVDYRLPGIKVQLFHGLGIEKKAHYKIRHFFDIYLTSGPFVTDRFIELQKKNAYFIVRETGWPKIDYILNYPAENVQALGLPAGKKIILYAPTFSTLHQSAESLLKVITQIIKSDELLLIKFHELMNKEIIAHYRSLDAQKIKILHNTDITPYLHAADLLISDTSSVIYEFMVLDKPIVTFKTMGATDKGIDVTNVSHLRNAIDRCLEFPDENKTNRAKHISKVNPYINGDISKRIITELIIIKENNLLFGKNKPVNFFRKIQIIYHDIFKKGYLR